MSDIFISYSRHDTDVVNELVALLEQEGYSVWIDRDGIESGEDFKRVILKAIKESKVILFFSSEHSNVSDWTAKEIGVAVKYNKYIVPVKLDDSNFNEAVEFDLINLDYVDYSKTATRPVMREKLLKALRNKLGRGIKEQERLEVERKAAAERERFEKERLERIEAERKAKEATERERLDRERKVEEAKRKAEQERLERERAEAQQREQRAAEVNLTAPSADVQPKSKKGLWIGIGLAAVIVSMVLLLVLPKKQSLSVSGTANGHEYVDLSGTANGHSWVDLGLPSGTLWATCNVGATKSEDYGNYYAWGETSTKSTYNWDTYKYANGNYDKLTKYCNKSGYGYNGFTDNLTTLQSGDDPATVNWGNGWRTPSKEQWEELLNNTANQWATRDGVTGRLFISKKNHQTLFLPAAGDWDSELYTGYSGYYWSRSLSPYSPSKAWGVNFQPDYCYVNYFYRYIGQSVRPVRSALQN